MKTAEVWRQFALIALGLTFGANLVTRARANDYYVDPTGQIAGSFVTVQSALNAVPAGTATNRTRIYLKPGAYTEQITAGSNKPFVSLLGQTSNAADTVLQYNL